MWWLRGALVKGQSTGLLLWCLCTFWSWTTPSNAQTLARITFKEHLLLGYGAPHSGTWSPDGKALAIGSSSGLWVYDDVAKPPRQLGDDDIEHVNWNPDGKTILAVGKTETKLWDVQAGTATTLPITGAYLAAWNTSGDRLALVDKDRTH